MDIGNKLKKLRVQKKIEPINMAELLAVSENTYRKYERNETGPTLKMLEKIAKIHDIELLELLSYEKILFNQTNKKGDNNGLVINHLSEKLIEQYDLRIAEKDDTIKQQKETIIEKDKIIKDLEAKLKASL